MEAPGCRYFRGPAVSCKLQAKTLQAFWSVKKSDVDVMMMTTSMSNTPQHGSCHQNNLAGSIKQDEEMGSSGHVIYLNAADPVDSCSEKQRNLFRATDMFFIPPAAQKPSLWPGLEKESSSLLPTLQEKKERSVTFDHKPILATEKKKKKRDFDYDALVSDPNGVAIALDRRKEVELEEKPDSTVSNKKETVISFKLRARQGGGTQKDDPILESHNSMGPKFNLLKTPESQEEDNELALQTQCMIPNRETLLESPSSSTSSSSDYSTETDNTHDDQTMRSRLSMLQNSSVKEEERELERDDEMGLIEVVAEEEAATVAAAGDTIMIHRKHRNSNPGRRIHSGRLYDSVLGQTCHWCRQKTVEPHCKCKLCPIQYCGPCLLNRNGEKLHEEMSQGLKWVCPKCRGGCGPGCDNCCNCGPCRKADGKMPTGQLVWTARSEGFDNVHDFLIHLKTGDAPEVIAHRKEGREWTAFGRSGQEAIQDFNNIENVEDVDIDEMKLTSTSGAIVVHQGCSENLKYGSKTGRIVQGGMGGAVHLDGYRDMSSNGFGDELELSEVKDEWDAADASLQCGCQESKHLLHHSKFNLTEYFREERMESKNSWTDLESTCKRQPEDVEQWMMSELGKFSVKKVKLGKWRESGEKASAAVSATEVLDHTSRPSSKLLNRRFADTATAVQSVKVAMAGGNGAEEPNIIIKLRNNNLPTTEERRMSIVESMTGSLNQTATGHSRTKACPILKPDDEDKDCSPLHETTTHKARIPILSMECPVSQASGTSDPVFSEVKTRENSFQRPLRRSWASPKLPDLMSAHEQGLNLTSLVDGPFKPWLPELEPGSETTEQVTRGVVTVVDSQSLGCLKKQEASEVVPTFVHKIKQLARLRNRKKSAIVSGTSGFKMVLCLPAPMQYNNV